MKPSIKREQRLYDALRMIARDFQTSSQLKKESETTWGLDASEALEYSYDNMQAIAKSAIKGMKRPTEDVQPTETPPTSETSTISK